MNNRNNNIKINFIFFVYDKFIKKINLIKLLKQCKIYNFIKISFI